MSSAQNEIDRIHEAEVEAQQIIKDAEDRAREIREETEEEIKTLLETAKADAKRDAEKMLNDIESKRMSIERDIRKEVDGEIVIVKDKASRKTSDAVKLAVKIMLGEE